MWKIWISAQGSYESNKRKWFKFKPDFVSGLVDTIDVVIVGGYRGSGKLSHVISSFLCAVRDDSYSPATFRTVCKVGSGITFSRLEALSRDLPFEGLNSVSAAPKWLHLPSSNKPDVIMRDIQQCAVWTILGAELLPYSTAHSAGLSVRFPRVVCERPDKDPATATSLAEITEMLRLQQEQRNGCSNIENGNNNTNNNNMQSSTKQENPQSNP